MDEIDADGLRRFIGSLKVVTKEELGKLLHFYAQRSPQGTITCDFCMMKCTANGFRDVDLIKFILRKVVYYVLQKKEYAGAEFEDVRDLIIKAERTFSMGSKSGEAGELLLFLLLEANDIIQLFSKMNLKTSANMPIHGVDAVHIQVENEIKLHFGHSKMYEDFTIALDSALDDVERFQTNPMKQTELNLLSSHIDESRFGGYAKVIRDLINPYENNRALYKETNSIFIAANEDFMKVAKNNGMTLDAFMMSEYEKKHDATASLINAKVSHKTAIKNEELLFFLMPMLDVADFRRKFKAELVKVG